MYTFDEIQAVDSEIAEAIQLEKGRQNQNIELIASENFVSKAVMAAMGSPLTNKYAEGYPGKRYYGGCQYVDIVENLAIERAKKLFGAAYVNVQPHSGAQANMAVFQAFLKPWVILLWVWLWIRAGICHTEAQPISQASISIVYLMVLMNKVLSTMMK